MKLFTLERSKELAELNFKQIADKLNEELTGDSRKLIFWYDEGGEFAEDIDTLELTNAKVYHLKQDNQFKTKIFLEREDKNTNYLIYAPFSKPSIRDNHLADTLRYSKEFFADRASLLTVDLGIDEKYKGVIKKYEKFFGAKERVKRFYGLEIERFTEETIKLALLSVLCKTKISSFEEVVRVILTESELEENKFLAEFAKYDLLEVFWNFCEVQFGYRDHEPSLEKLMLTMFCTYAERYISADLPKAWQSFISYKSGNIIAFLDNLMNNVLYHEQFNELSALVGKQLNIKESLKKYTPDSFLACEVFAGIDEMIIDWMKERLLDENIGATLSGMPMTTVTQMRMKKHFGIKYGIEYKLIEAAYYLIQGAQYECPSDFKALIGQYGQKDYLLDYYYRQFYYHYDQLEDNVPYEKLRDLVENIYTNEYLSKQLTSFNQGIVSEGAFEVLPRQTQFFSKFIKLAKERKIVIISDAMRYEVGQELLQKLQESAKCSAEIEMMLGVIPSYTRLGMAALLPHQTLELADDYKVLVDGMTCDDLKSRENVLRQYVPNGKCVQFDDIKLMKKTELLQEFAGAEMVYIYHNQIDARGDKPNTENEVFVACKEAVDEIYELIIRLTDNINVTRFVVTADHGFLYKRDKLQESDKIGNVADKGSFINKRFIVSGAAYQDDGIAHLPMRTILENNDTKMISFPITSHIFKASGGGQNYVHGGSSPQEILIPVVTVKTERGYKEVKNASIMLVSMLQKITGLNTTLDFIQSEAVGKLVKETTYKLYFITEDNERISNENIYVADKKDEEPQKRVFRMSFRFKDRKYDKTSKYYLVGHDEKNNLEVLRHEVMMDIAFANDFGFNL